VPLTIWTNVAKASPSSKDLKGLRKDRPNGSRCDPDGEGVPTLSLARGSLSDQNSLKGRLGQSSSDECTE